MLQEVNQQYLCRAIENLKKYQVLVVTDLLRQDIRGGEPLKKKS